jgi:Glycosyltransferase
MTAPTLSEDVEQRPAAVQRDIFIVSNSVDELGGVARWAHQIACLFAGRGHRVHQIGIVPAEEKADFGAGLPYRSTTLYAEHPSPVWWPRHWWQRADLVSRRRQAVREAGMRTTADRMSAIFRTAGPGAVVIVTQVWAMEWVVRADTSGLQVIGMSHESFEYSRDSSRFGRVRKYYADVDRLLLLTQEDADSWIRNGMNHAGAIANPMPLLPSRFSPRSAKVVASIGRLAEQKGVDMLLDAWAEASVGRADWRLRIYGTGEDEALLKQQCTRLGLDDSVEFAGRTDDVEGVLCESSVFVQSSRGEGFPLALMEAMACGVPCVAFDCAPGVREIIRDEEDGLLAAVGNTSALARQLGRLLDDSELRDTMGERARVNIRRYAPNVIEQRWEDLFALLER